MRIGVFGGSFDPVHVGHLIVAEQCREQARLDQVWFIPAARPPHKREQALAPFAHRVQMLALAVAGYPAFQVDELEQDRPGPSFTHDTLAVLGQRHPDADFHLILGSDCLPDMPGWREPARIAEQAGLLIVPRLDSPVWPPEQLQAALGLAEGFPLRHQVIDAPLIAISSREIRRRVAEGRSIRFLVPRPVECYIETHQLYKIPNPS